MCLLGGESGSADTARDPRGFAVKFYTEDGNWDLVGNNTPIFFIRDPIFVSHCLILICDTKLCEIYFLVSVIYSHSKKKPTNSLERSRYVLGFHISSARNYSSGCIF